MTTGYQYHQVDNFNLLGLKEVNQEWQSTTQLGLPGEDDDIHSLIRYLGISDNPDFLKFFVVHETIRTQSVRFGNVRRENFIAIEEFHLFMPKNLTYLYASTNNRICNELLRRVKKDFPNFQFKNRIVDLAGLKSLFLSDVRGGWFKELNIADVSAAAIFGSNVGDSDDWQRYEDSGEISALTIEFLYAGARHSVQITRNGTLVLYENFKESYALKLLENINEVVMKFSEDVKI